MFGMAHRQVFLVMTRPRLFLLLFRVIVTTVAASSGFGPAAFQTTAAGYIGSAACGTCRARETMQD